MRSSRLGGNGTARSIGNIRRLASAWPPATAGTSVLRHRRGAHGAGARSPGAGHFGPLRDSLHLLRYPRAGHSLHKGLTKTVVRPGRCPTAPFSVIETSKMSTPRPCLSAICQAGGRRDRKGNLRPIRRSKTAIRSARSAGELLTAPAAGPRGNVSAGPRIHRRHPWRAVTRPA